MIVRKLSIFFIGLIVFLAVPRILDFSVPISTAKASANPIITVNVSLAENTIDTPQSFLIRGIKAYESENLVEAVNYWKNAEQIFEERDDYLSNALTQSYLTLAYQKLGQWQKAEASLQKGRELIKNLDRNSIYLEIETKLLNSQASFDWHKNNLESALQNWNLAIANYQQLGDLYGLINTKINRAQTLQFLGFTFKAKKELEEIYDSLQDRSKETSLKQQLTGFRLIGSVYRRLGKLEESVKSLQQGLGIARESRSIEAEGKLLLELGNTERIIGNKYLTVGDIKLADLSHTKAIDWYRQAREKTQGIEPRLNLLNLSIELGQWQEIEFLIKEIKSIRDTLPDNRQSLAIDLNFIQNLTCIEQITKLQDSSCVKLEFRDNLDRKIDRNDLIKIASLSWQQIGSLLATVIEKSQQLQDRYIEAYATIQLGNLYEIDRQWQPARELTAKALVIAEELQSPELRYKGEWQLGRLLEKQNNLIGAISAYSSTVKDLKLVRQNIGLFDDNTFFSFQDSVEPVYRKLVDLLLRKADSDSNNLKLAIETIDSFKLAELENFLGCKLNLLLNLDNNLEKIDPQAVSIYPIILSDRLEVLYQFPNEKIAHFTASIDENTLKKTIEGLREALVRRDVGSVKDRADRLYQWLFAPLALELQKHPQAKNLIFIADSYLQTIPFAVLYDRNSQEYLLQKDFNIVNLPSTKIFNIQNKTENLTVLGGGITEEMQVEDIVFKAIDTKQELQKIDRNIETKILIDRDFTEDNLARNLQEENYSIVHLATHGNFSSDPEKTFLVLYDTLDESGKLLKAKDLDKIVRLSNLNDDKKLELLVLSACQSALGDKRATLGLAGMTISAGANSSIGTLWQVTDESAIEFMDRFYQELVKPNVNKAEAIRVAQKALFNNPKYRNPYYWSPFVLVGNWL
jgi:CHAT domain-containing protein